MGCRVCGYHGGQHSATCPRGVRGRLRCEKCGGKWSWLRDQCLVCGVTAKVLADVPDKSVEPPPVIDGELVGFRQWSVDLETWRLHGMGAGHATAWEPEINSAACEKGHRAPAEVCGCGLYGYAKPDPRWRGDRVATAGNWLAGHRPAVAGAMLAWGDEFYLHPGGFRAEYAKPVLLAVCDDWPKPLRAAVEAIADEYGCDTCEFAILEAAAREHGQLVPEAMMPAGEDATGALGAWGGFGVIAAQAKGLAWAPREIREIVSLTEHELCEIVTLSGLASVTSRPSPEEMSAAITESQQRGLRELRRLAGLDP